MSEEIEIKQIWIAPNEIPLTEVFPRGCYAVLTKDKVLEVRHANREEALELMQRFDEN